MSDWNNDNGGGFKRDYPPKPGYNNNGGGFNKGGFEKKPFFKKSDKPPYDQLYKVYAFTGQDNVPDHISSSITRLVHELEAVGYTVRTGGMKGVEGIVEAAANKEHMELHLPWKGFDNKVSEYSFTTDDVKALAAKLKPNFAELKLPVQGFICKDLRLLLGRNIKGPVRFVLAWTEDGAETPSEITKTTGNLRMIIEIADQMVIPVFNLGKQDAEKRLKQYLRMSNNGSQQISESEF